MWEMKIGHNPKKWRIGCPQAKASTTRSSLGQLTDSFPSNRENFVFSLKRNFPENIREKNFHQRALKIHAILVDKQMKECYNYLVICNKGENALFPYIG